MKYRSAILLVALVILIDQIIKVYVKTHFYLGEEVILAGKWAKLHFLENEGMAFGMKLGEGHIGKTILTLFRLLAVIVGFGLLWKLCRGGYSRGMVVCGALILAGAAGNLIDSMFYGLIFSESYHHQAQFVPWGTGYAPFLHGRVVDMFYFPLFTTKLPAWMPFVGGNEFSFFEPVFNFADAAISAGVLTLVIFQKRLLRKEEEAQESIAGTHPETSEVVVDVQPVASPQEARVAPKES
jgi:signal peptidase II